MGVHEPGKDGLKTHTRTKAETVHDSKGQTQDLVW